MEFGSHQKSLSVFKKVTITRWWPVNWIYTLDNVLCTMWLVLTTLGMVTWKMVESTPTTSNKKKHFQWMKGISNSKTRICIKEESPWSDWSANSWFDYTCSSSVCGIWENKISPVFKMRGICKGSRFKSCFTSTNEGGREYLGYVVSLKHGIRYI